MTLVARRAALSAFALATVMPVCAHAAGRGVQSYGNAPYLGQLEATMRVPGTAKAGKRDIGTGSAQFIDTGGGRIRLVVVGSIEKPGDAGFVIDGISSGSGWTSRSGGMVFSVAADGRISGGGTLPPQRMRFAGSVSEGRFELKVDLELIERNGKGLPPGTRFTFDYDLRRSPG
ncbi:MAG: hypothetical protein ACREO8_13220, partial [Luteimonas sp.]